MGIWHVQVRGFGDGCDAVRVCHGGIDQHKAAQSLTDWRGLPKCGEQGRKTSLKQNSKQRLGFIRWECTPSRFWREQNILTCGHGVAECCRVYPTLRRLSIIDWYISSGRRFTLAPLVFSLFQLWLDCIAQLSVVANRYESAQIRFQIFEYHSYHELSLDTL